MSILNVNQIQPVGSGQTVTISATNISAGSATVTAGTFSGGVTVTSGNLTGITSVSTSNLTVNGNAYPATGSLSNRNKIINGDMRIDQRNAGSSYTITGDTQYTLDRWVARTYAGPGRFSVQQDSSSPDSINPSAKLTVTTTDTPGTYGYAFSQRVEGYNFSSLAYGSSSAKAATISFWVRSSITGTYCFSVRNSDASRSYIAEYSISSANTWEYKTITIPGATDGTWLTTNGVGAYLEWNLGAQTSKEATAGSWQSGNYHATSSQVDWIATSGATFYITGVQLEVGSVATPFEHRSYGDELARCQRYYYAHYRRGSSSDGATAFGTAGSFYTTTEVYTNILFPVTLRTDPTLVTPNRTDAFGYPVAGATKFGPTLTLIHEHPNGCAVYTTTTASATAGQVCNPYMNTANWVEGDILAFNAEL